MEIAAREARAKEVGGRLHRPHRPQGTNLPDRTTTARAPGQVPYVGHVITPPLQARLARESRNPRSKEYAKARESSVQTANSVPK